MEKKIEKMDQIDGKIQNIIFKGGSIYSVKALYAHSPIEQHCIIPHSLGCELTDEGYIKIEASHKTSVDGVFACGDNVTRIRTVANAVTMGTTTGIMLNKEFILENF